MHMIKESVTVYKEVNNMINFRGDFFRYDTFYRYAQILLINIFTKLNEFSEKLDFRFLNTFQVQYEHIYTSTIYVSLLVKIPNTFFLCVLYIKVIYISYNNI